MSRLPSSGDQIIVKPSNNIYTALAVVGFVVVLIGLILLCLLAIKLQGTSPFTSGT